MKLHQFATPFIDSTGPAPKAIEKVRVCKCGKTLSRYNQGPKCYSCQEEESARKLDKIDLRSTKMGMQSCKRMERPDI